MRVIAVLLILCVTSVTVARQQIPFGFFRATSVALYAPSGPQQGVAVSALSGWTQCYSATYDVDMNTTVVSNIESSLCTKAKVMVACRPTGSATITLLGWAPRASVFGWTTGTNTTLDNGIRWYRVTTGAVGGWGFMGPGETALSGVLHCDSGDASATRLCNHMFTSFAAGGYRCGAATSLNTDNTWERVIYHAD